MLLHIYRTGRFGAERHIGFVITDNAECLQATTYITFDIVKDAVIADNFWTNPHAIANVTSYKIWKRMHAS